MSGPPRAGDAKIEEEQVSMNSFYYAAIDKMEKAGVNRDYIVGWASGYLHNPKVEEQRLTDAYNAGYDDGVEQKDDNFGSWVKK